MHLSSCGTFLIANVLSIFFLFAFFFSGVDAQHNSDLLPRCPSGFRSTEPWWHPLRTADENHDPCNLFKSIRDRDAFAVTCCFADPDQNIAKRGDDENKPCGPCNLQTYNIASACKACESFAYSAPRQEDVAQSISQFPSFTSWKANEDLSQSHGFETLPAWTNTSVTPGDVFDINNVLLMANTPSPSPAPSPSNAPPVQSPVATGAANSPPSPKPSGGSSTGSGDSFMKQGSSKMQAGAVAGGVIGGIVFMAILLLGMIYLIRSRRAHRPAPSTAFASISRPVTSPPRDLEDAPPLRVETKSTWRPFPLEKWPSTASGTSQHGLMSNTSPWGRDIEKY